VAARSNVGAATLAIAARKNRAKVIHNKTSDLTGRKTGQYRVDRRITAGRLVLAAISKKRMTGNTSGTKSSWRCKSLILHDHSKFCFTFEGCT
jgi:hypothetical protein